MELSPLSVLVLLMLDLHLVYGAPGPASGLGPRQAFLPAKAASSFLRRQKRYNTGVFEEFLEGNLERECFEERCDLEEAREVFENDDKTMAFWSGYVDGNQCKSHPCLNQGSCNDGLGSYTCSCPSGITGRNCEIVLAKRCDVNNGDCLHFCETMGTFGAKCSCANGYSLTLDGLSCEPDDEFPCGRTAITEFRQVSTRSLLRKKDTIPQNATALISITTIISPSPSEAGTTTSIPATDASTEPGLPHWMDSYDVNPTGEQPRPRKRIVGGEMIIPGEVPWQVALKRRRSGEIVCGGSILSKHWVITAAHCLLEDKDSYIIRVGEDNIYIHEDKEQDHKILEQYIHPRYNGTASLYNHDIALIYLKSAITFSTIVRPICLGPMLFTERLVKESSPATVSGWGRTRFLGLTADSLQKVEVPFVDRTECKRSSNSRITQFMFCAGYDDVAKDACQGDSGGPHANRFHDTWFLTGIVSWGEECAMDGKYGVYTRVSLYYRWITHVMGLTEHQLELDVENPDSQR